MQGSVPFLLRPTSAVPGPGVVVLAAAAVHELLAVIYLSVLIVVTLTVVAVVHLVGFGNRGTLGRCRSF